MENKKILSVIIPTYNMEKYLNRCLDSFLIGNTDELEVVIVNDGSTDKSEDIANEYVLNHPNIFRLLNKKNGNYGSTINAALTTLKGLYVKVVDADDWIETAYLSRYLSMLSNTDADIILSPFYFSFINGTRKEKTLNIKNVTCGKKYKYEDFTSFFFTDMYTTHCITYKLNIFSLFQYVQTEGVSYTDQEWVFKPIVHLNSICFFDHPLYNYYIGRDGQTIEYSMKIKHSIDNYIGIKEMLSFQLKNSQVSINKKKIMDKMIIDRSLGLYIIELIFNSDKKKAMNMLDKLDALLIDKKDILSQVEEYHKIGFGKFIKKWILKRAFPNKYKTKLFIHLRNLVSKFR